MAYTPKQFSIPELDGISSETIDLHLKLYEGYVKNLNIVLDTIDGKFDTDPYLQKEAIRRQAFEFDGMRNHEHYFGALEGGATELSSDSKLAQMLDDQQGGKDKWQENFIKWIAGQRGIGWAVLGLDTHVNELRNYWVDEQHLGHLTGVQPIVMLDMWEHSYMRDYLPSDKGEYMKAYLRNLNWETVAKHLE